MKLVVAACLLTASTALADPPADQTQAKNPGDALALSIGVTAGGIGMLVTGDWFHQPVLTGAGALAVLVGPTTGHIYSGDTLNVGLAVRGGGLVVGAAGLYLFQPCLGGGVASGPGGADSWGCSNAHRDVVLGVIVGGGLAFLGGSVYEIATAPSAVHRYNREHGFEATVVPTGNGLALAGRF